MRGELVKRRADLLTYVSVNIVGWGNTPTEASFGGGGNDAASVKGKLVNLISSVRTLMRSEFIEFPFIWVGVGGGLLFSGGFLVGKGEYSDG